MAVRALELPIHQSIINSKVASETIIQQIFYRIYQKKNVVLLKLKDTKHTAYIITHEHKHTEILIYS